MPGTKDTATNASANPQIAPLRRRFMAMLYDTFLLAAMLLCASALYTIIVVTINGDFNQHGSVSTNDTIHELTPTNLGWPIYPTLAAVYLGFFIYFWRATGQTLGMLVWKIKLVSSKQAPVSFTQCLVRIGAAILSAAVLGLGYWTLLWGDKQGTWHDKLSGTKVIYLKPD